MDFILTAMNEYLFIFIFMYVNVHCEGYRMMVINISSRQKKLYTFKFTIATYP